MSRLHDSSLVPVILCAKRASPGICRPSRALRQRWASQPWSPAGLTRWATGPLPSPVAAGGSPAVVVLWMLQPPVAFHQSCPASCIQCATLHLWEGR